MQLKPPEKVLSDMSKLMYGGTLDPTVLKLLPYQFLHAPTIARAGSSSEARAPRAEPTVYGSPLASNLTKFLMIGFIRASSSRQ